ncbi:MAG: PA0069 family radical SAM protein [Chitinophagales bacterium]
MTKKGDYIKGRGAQIQVQNRFHKEISVPLEECLNEEQQKPKTQYLKVFPKTIVNKVTSPDIGSAYSMNPYQGCEHGCIYCYARTTHEYWGYNAGLDFERVILLKENSAALLEQRITNKNWEVSPIMLSGNTDCYQPIEQKLGITRNILKVFQKYLHPVGIITKNALILRDLDILTDLAKDNLVKVSISLTGLDENLRQQLEPRTSTYAKRLHAVEILSSKGIPVNIMMAPIIPALNSDDIMNVAKASANAGALSLNYTMVRLNGQIAVVFKDWIEKNFPDRASKVIHQIESMHGGKLSDSRFGTRMKGEGKIANILKQQFNVARKLHFANRKMPDYNLSVFRRQQLTLFE